MGTWGGTRGETRPGGEQGVNLPRRGGGGGSTIGTGGRRNTHGDIAELAGSESEITSIASTPESISGDGGGARVPSRGEGDCGSWLDALAGRASINVDAKPPARRRRTRRATSCWSKPRNSLFTLATKLSLELGPSSTFIASTPALKTSCRRHSLSACKATILRYTEAMNWRSARTRLLFLGRLAMGRMRTVADARAEGGTRAPLRRRRASTGRGRLSPGGGSCAGVCSNAGAVGNGIAFSSRCTGSRAVDESGFHERKAVVLVRATVGDAFWDGKRGGWLQSALACLLTDGFKDIVFVLSPKARKVVTIALERKPSGAERRV